MFKREPSRSLPAWLWPRAATLRRIVVGISGMTPEERKRLADYMRASDPSFTKTLENLDKG